MNEVGEENSGSVDHRPAKPTVTRKMDSRPSTRLDVSCSADEIRLDAATAVEALAGLREAAKREAIHGRSIVANQHVTSAYFAPVWQLSDDLQRRGMRLDGGRTMGLDLPDELNPKQQQDARNVYFDLYRYIVLVDGPAAENDAGRFPHVADEFLTGFADVTARLQTLAGFLASPRVGGVIEHAGTVSDARVREKVAKSTPARTSERRGYKKLKINEYFTNLINQAIDVSNEGGLPLPFGTQDDIAQCLKVNKGTVSKGWKEFSKTKFGKLAIKIGMTANWGGQYGMASGSGIPRGWNPNGGIESYDSESSAHDKDDD